MSINPLVQMNCVPLIQHRLGTINYRFMNLSYYRFRQLSPGLDTVYWVISAQETFNRFTELLQGWETFIIGLGQFYCLRYFSRLHKLFLGRGNIFKDLDTFLGLGNSLMSSFPSQCVGNPFFRKKETCSGFSKTVLGLGKPVLGFKNITRFMKTCSRFKKTCSRFRKTCSMFRETCYRFNKSVLG